MPDTITHEKYAFKMKLLPGKAAEYRRRHDDIWPALVGPLKDAGSPTIPSIWTRRRECSSGCCGVGRIIRWQRYLSETAPRARNRLGAVRQAQYAP